MIGVKLEGETAHSEQIERASVTNFQSNSVLNQEVFQKQFSTDSKPVHVKLGSEIL